MTQKIDMSKPFGGAPKYDGREDAQRPVDASVSRPYERPFAPYAEGSFPYELQELINRHSIEGGSNTPDYILAEYLKGCLENFDMCVRRREQHCGSGTTDMSDGTPGDDMTENPQEVAGRGKNGLLCCPFCGAEAEMDLSRGYRDMTTGNWGSEVAIYCTVCPADMAICCEDVPEAKTEQLADELTESWNRRASRNEG